MYCAKHHSAEIKRDATAMQSARSGCSSGNHGEWCAGAANGSGIPPGSRSGSFRSWITPRETATLCGTPPLSGCAPDQNSTASCCPRPRPSKPFISGPKAPVQNMREALPHLHCVEIADFNVDQQCDAATFATVVARCRAWAEALTLRCTWVQVAEWVVGGGSSSLLTDSDSSDSDTASSSSRGAERSRLQTLRLGSYTLPGS